MPSHPGIFRKGRGGGERGGGEWGSRDSPAHRGLRAWLPLQGQLVELILRLVLIQRYLGHPGRITPTAPDALRSPLSRAQAHRSTYRPKLSPEPRPEARLSTKASLEQRPHTSLAHRADPHSLASNLEHNALSRIQPRVQVRTRPRALKLSLNLALNPASRIQLRFQS